MTEFDPTCVKRALSWMANAEDDLGVAYENFERERYAWSAYIAAIAAEKSMKAVIYLFHKDPPRMNHHDISSYFKRAATDAPELASARESIGVFSAFDSYLRYPDRFDLSHPADRYREDQAAGALEAAGQILPAARAIINKAAEIINEATS